MNSYSLDYIDDLYVQYVRDPNSVSETWRRYFEQFLVATSDGSPDTDSSAQGASESVDQALWLSKIQDYGT